MITEGKHLNGDVQKDEMTFDFWGWSLDTFDGQLMLTNKKKEAHARLTLDLAENKMMENRRDAQKDVLSVWMRRYEVDGNKHAALC